MIKHISGYNNNSMKMPDGNLTKTRFRHVFTGADKNGDVFALGELGFDVTYTGLQLVSVSGLGAGVTVDVGFMGRESHTEVPDWFIKGVDVSAKNTNKQYPLLRLMRDEYRHACECENKGDKPPCKPQWGELHEPTFTLHGTPAAGACLDIILEYVYEN